MKKLVSALLVLAMLCTLAVAGLADNTEKPLVKASDALNGKFSPLFSDSAPDTDVASMTQLTMLQSDRLGAIVYNGIEGETIPYNGTDYTYYGASDLKVKFDEAANITTYTVKIREDLKFSDGEPVTADDIIFTYYLFLDPSYVGSTTLSSYPIIGLKDYRTQTTSEIFAKYEKLGNEILAKGRDYKVAEGDEFTQEQYDDLWAKEHEMWMNNLSGLVNFVVKKYAEQAAGLIGLEADKVNDNDHVAMAFATWNFGTYDAGTGILKGNATGTEFNIKEGKRPTLDDLYKETYELYKGNGNDFWAKENYTNNGEFNSVLVSDFVTLWGPKDDSMAGKGVPNIAGIKKLDNYTVEVTTEGYEAPAIYQIFGVPILPIHYYGDKAQYDYDNNKFGHPFGDLKIAESRTSAPMGAGPYKFIKYENKVVYFEANDYYFKGAPKIKYIQFKETQASETVPGVQSGVIDIGDMNGSKSNYELVKSYNSNGELVGDTITTYRVDYRGYGYIGLNADKINVGGKENKASDESKALRKALATMISVLRNISIDSYYGEAASVIEYPISNTSWAAPQPTDSDYKAAFSTDPEGNQIYTPDMTFEQRVEAALNASIAWFKKAGYTFDEASGKFTAAPEGAKLSYEVLIGGGGQGDHPSYAIITQAREQFEKIGIELKINDPAESSIMWDILDKGSQELWCAAWQATVDPDMYQIYHSSSVKGAGGSESNHYAIQDPQLDELIVEARRSDDQSFRKTVYKEALDIIVDWGVEIPIYQRKNSTIISSARVNIDTVAKDITTFYGVFDEIEKLELR